MPGYIKGILIAFANTILVAVFIALWLDNGKHVGEAVFVISLMGFFPAALVGGLLGHHAETQQSANRRVVLVGMIAVACTCVALLGLMFGLPDPVLLACVPTALSCCVLERWTRQKREDDFPAARVA